MRLLNSIAVLATAALAIDPRVPGRAKEAEPATPGLVPRVTGQQFNCSAIGTSNAGSTSGQSYFNGQPDGCPLINRIDPDGSCKSSMTVQHGACAGYCEVRNYYFYGQEVPFVPYAGCRIGDVCSVDSSFTASISQSFSFNVGAGINSKRDVTTAPPAVLKGAFNIGASFTYQTTTTVAHGTTNSRAVAGNASDCGYWASIPVFWVSCGTMTTSPTAPGFEGSGNIFAIDPTAAITPGETATPELFTQLPNLPGDTTTCVEPRCASSSKSLSGRSVKLNGACLNTKAHTTTNYCNTTPYRDNDGQLQTQSIFVRTGCASGKLQPKEFQDPIYIKPGVAAKPFSTTFQY